VGKRLTDQNKWDDPWFSVLDERGKLIWLYLCDRCDSAGVWAVNARAASFHLGFPFDALEAINLLGDRIEIFDEGRKWFLRKFIAFQYPNGLSDDSKAHRAILGLVKYHGLDLAKFPHHSKRYPDSISTVLDKTDSLGSSGSSPWGSPEGGEIRRAPGDLPERLRDTWAEIVQSNGADVADKALAAAKRIFHGPTAKQLLETWKAAHEAGKIKSPADEWPDFRKRMKREQAKQKTDAVGEAITDERLAAYDSIPVTEVNDDQRW
jgi:hypothetical protein